MTDKAVIYADGSCLGNPGPGGWGAIAVDPISGKNLWKISGSESETTNNRMEITAAIEALRHFKKEHFIPDSGPGSNYSPKIFLHTDSNLLVQTINRGWKKKMNLDLWMELDEMRKGLDIEFIWVKGHADDPWNLQCDELAQSAARKELRKASSRTTIRDPHRQSDDNKIQRTLF